MIIIINEKNHDKPKKNKNKMSKFGKRFVEDIRIANNIRQSNLSHSDRKEVYGQQTHKAYWLG